MRGGRGRRDAREPGAAAGGSGRSGSTQQHPAAQQCSTVQARQLGLACLSLRSPQALLAAAARLVHEERGGHANVEAVHKAVHGHRARRVRQRHRLGADACGPQVVRETDQQGSAAVSAQVAGASWRPLASRLPCSPLESALHPPPLTLLLVAQHKRGGAGPVDLADGHRAGAACMQGGQKGGAQKGPGRRRDQSWCTWMGDARRQQACIQSEQSTGAGRSTTSVLCAPLPSPQACGHNLVAEPLCSPQALLRWRARRGAGAAAAFSRARAATQPGWAGLPHSGAPPAQRRSAAARCPLQCCCRPSPPSCRTLGRPATCPPPPTTACSAGPRGGGAGAGVGRGPKPRGSHSVGGKASGARRG